MNDLQKAGMWKRISAASFDFILLIIVIVGMALVLSLALGFDRQLDRQTVLIEAYEVKYSVDFDQYPETVVDMSDEAVAALPEEERTAYLEKKAYREAYIEASKACDADPELRQITSTLVSLTFVIATFSILIADILLGLVVPLILKNGRTLGKKIFGLAVMREDGIRVTPFVMTVRTILGKFTVETMVPIYLLIMGLMTSMGFFVPTIVMLILLITQIVLLMKTHGRTPIHDLFARTVVVDFSSQRIFDSMEEKEAYIRRLREERDHNTAD